MRALAFICRTTNPAQPIRLQHRLKSRQTALFDSLLDLAAKRVANPFSVQLPLDRACLDFCISLLDQPLHGNMFDSILVEFFAVLGIDESNERFHEAPNYTPKLSGFIKIAQLLVL